jgi:hypothetical protein
MTKKNPPLGPTEKSILKKFLEFNPEVVSKIFSIDGPRSNFPDFIIDCERGQISVEITRAPSSEARMKGLNFANLFQDFIEPKLQSIGISYSPVFPDEPNLITIDAFEHKEEIWKWVNSINRLSISEGNSFLKEFGSCSMELQMENGELSLGFSNNSPPFSTMPFAIYRMCENVARYILDAIKSKIDKYRPDDKKANYLLVTPIYWEPLMPEDLLNEIRLKTCIVNQIKTQKVGNVLLPDIFNYLFGEIWVVLPFAAIKIFPE